MKRQVSDVPWAVASVPLSRNGSDDVRYRYHGYGTILLNDKAKKHLRERGEQSSTYD